MVGGPADFPEAAHSEGGGVPELIGVGVQFVDEASGVDVAPCLGAADGADVVGVVFGRGRALGVVGGSGVALVEAAVGCAAPHGSPNIDAGSRPCGGFRLVVVGHGRLRSAVAGTAGRGRVL